MKHSKLLVGLTVALTATLVLTGCGSKSASSSSSSSSAPAKQSKILAVGSTALQPLVEQAAKQYQTDNPKSGDHCPRRRFRCRLKPSGSRIGHDR